MFKFNVNVNVFIVSVKFQLTEWDYFQFQFLFQLIEIPLIFSHITVTKRYLLSYDFSSAKPETRRSRKILVSLNTKM